MSAPVEPTFSLAIEKNSAWCWEPLNTSSSAARRSIRNLKGETP